MNKKAQFEKLIGLILVIAIGILMIILIWNVIK